MPPVSPRPCTECWVGTGRSQCQSDKGHQLSACTVAHPLGPLVSPQCGTCHCFQFQFCCHWPTRLQCSQCLETPVQCTLIGLVCQSRLGFVWQTQWWRLSLAELEMREIRWVKRNRDRRIKAKQCGRHGRYVETHCRSWRICAFLVLPLDCQAGSFLTHTRTPPPQIPWLGQMLELWRYQDDHGFDSSTQLQFLSLWWWC